MVKKSLPLSQVYRLIEPGPVVMVTTASGKRANIMTMSWHMMIDFEPPILACVISDRDYTFDILKKTKECVINIPTVELAKKVVACGTHPGGILISLRVRPYASAAACVHAPLITNATPILNAG